MENNQKQNNQNEKESTKKQSLQSDDKEVLKNRDPREDSEAISHAGKTRDESKRYQ